MYPLCTLTPPLGSYYPHHHHQHTHTHTHTPHTQKSEGGGELAKKLVELYFTMFRLVIEGHFGRAGEARK